MVNLEVYDESAIEFYNDVVKGKRRSNLDSTYKERLSGLNARVRERFRIYDDKFGTKSLEDISPASFKPEEKRDLLSLYRFGAKKIVDLRLSLTTTKNQLISNACQNCTIGEINTFDHYLPKETYPEFSINPKNLIPSCSKCNSFKGTTWIESGKRLFLNPYNDILPTKEFLFADIKASENDIAISFSIDNRNSLPNELFEIVESHYTRLYLCSRFVDSCENIITELKTEIKKYSKSMHMSDIIETVKDCAEENRQHYGYNHYRYVLQIALVNNMSFLNKYVGV